MRIILALLFCFSANADILMTITKSDGSFYHKDSFATQADADAWVTKAKATVAWNPTYIVTFVDNTPDPSIDIAFKAALAQKAADQNTRKTQIQNAISNWSSLTAAQKDAVLKVVLTHLVN